AIGVAAQLEPAVELAVVGEQHARAPAVDQPGRSGEMTGQASPFEGIRVVEQADESGRDRGLIGASRGMVEQFAAQAFGFGHGFHAWWYVRSWAGQHSRRCLPAAGRAGDAASGLAARIARAV